MKKLAIIGHPLEGDKIVEILKMLGGKNENYWECKNPLLSYYINDRGEFDYINNCNPNEDILRYTLEKFLEKYPYKIGDMIRVPEFESEVCINDMKWDGYNIQYEVFTDETEWYTAEELNNWNTKNIEKKEPNSILLQLKKYFEETPREIIEKEWHEYDKYNEVGPAVGKYLEYVNTIRQPQYPKTYEECCDVISRFAEYDFNKKRELLLNFNKLIKCRDAYWKIACEQMGLGKPWEPDWDDENEFKYGLYHFRNGIMRDGSCINSTLLAFPTEEMRDAFYENFKDLIEYCKELL